MTESITERTPVVWIINEGGHDYTKAEKFGRPLPITVGGVNPFSPDRLMVTIASRLKMATEEDWLLISGTPILNALAMMLWVTRFGKAKILLWSVRDEDYKVLTITVQQIERMAHWDGKPAP